ncbi:unnamed protein product [Heterobilharzia americana]|nr:unnamed protein product [Heterobilharzia americana]
MRYMKNVGSRDKFVIFDSPNNENASDDLKCDNQASPANQRFSVNRHVVNSDQVSSQWSLGPSEGLLSNHGLKFAPNTPPLPPKSVNSGARYANVMKDQNFGSCSSYLDQKRTVEQPRPSRQNAVATESHKNCKPEKSASPILAFDANRVCENRQGAVRFQENIGNFSVWKKDEYFTDFASISQSTECNPEDHSERAHSTDSSKTPVPVHLENMKINHHKAADTANVHTTYDNGCNLSAAEYDVPADTAGQRDSSPISLMRDIYSKQKCFNGTKSPISSPHKPPLVLNAQQVIAGQQYQERKIQRGDRSEESEKEQHINPNSANYQGVNGDYDESFNDLFPVKCHLNGLKAYVSPSQANSPINLTLATNTENVSFKSVQLEEVKNLEAFTSSKGGEDLSLDKHRIMSNGFQNPNNGSHSTTSHLTVPTSFHDSDVNISSISKENMLTLATNLLMQSSILQQYGSHLIMSPNNFLHDDSFSSYSRQHSPSQVHKLYTYNLEAKRKPTNNKYSSDVSVAVHDKTVEVKGNNNLANLKPTNKPSNTKHHNGVSIPVHGCKKTQATVHDMEYFESYPSLFDVLHHCDIYRVLLDPNLPSLSDQLGLNLCLTKFPLDDVQRADTLQKLKNNEIYEKGMSNDSINSIQSLSNPKGPKARIRSRKGGAFQPVDIKRSDMGFDVVTIESIEPDSPASFEGSLAPGHIILEVDGKDLLRPHYFKDANGNRMNILDVAQNQLQAARQAALTGEIPHIRITAAQYHANFGLANTANNPERLSSSLRSKNGVNGKIQPISIFQSGNNNHNENNKCSKKHNNVHIDRPESTSQTEYLTQTHECYNTPRETPYQSEINSKSISELTDYSEDGVNSLKSKLIWFPHHKDEYSSRSPFDPRSPELSVRL